MLYSIALFIAILLFIFGLIIILHSIYKIPNINDSKNINSFGNTKEKKNKKTEQIIEDFAYKIIPFIKISEIAKNELEEKLSLLDIKETPEKFIAKCIVKNFIYIIPGLILLIVGQIYGIGLIIYGIIAIFNSINHLNKLIKIKKDKIEKEIPRYLSFVAQSFNSTKNVQQVLNNYKNIAGEELKKELNITVADMMSGGSGGKETALTNMNNRINSRELDKVNNAIISVAIRGENNTAYLKELEKEMTKEEVETLKRHAFSIPQKINKYQVIILIIIVVISMFAMCYSVVDEFNIIFKR